MHFPYSFLKGVAKEYRLSRTELAVFLLRYQEDLDYDDISKRLDIAKAATFKRMGQIYLRFDISGGSKGKEAKLVSCLYRKQEEYDQSRSHRSAQPDKIAEDEWQAIQYQLNSLREEINRLKNKSNLGVSTAQEARHDDESCDPITFIEDIITKLEQGESGSALLKEVAMELPKLIERQAASSVQYNEKDLVSKLLRMMKDFFRQLDGELPEEAEHQLNQDGSVDTLQ